MTSTLYILCVNINAGIFALSFSSVYFKQCKNVIRINYHFDTKRLHRTILSYIINIYRNNSNNKKKKKKKYGKKINENSKLQEWRVNKTQQKIVI